MKLFASIAIAVLSSSVIHQDVLLSMNVTERLGFDNEGQEVTRLLERLNTRVEGDTIILPTDEERKNVTKNILSIARQSSQSRQIVIESLMEAFKHEHASSDTRIYIAYLFSEIRAVEALDLIAQYLDIKGSFSSLSLSIMPMVDAIVRYGELAVPYLEKALSNGNILIREQACVALGFIGGDDAERVLQRTLIEQPDSAVIEYALGALREIEIAKRQPKRKKNR